MKIREAAPVGIFAAVIAVCAQVSVPLPFSPIPFSMQIFSVMLASVVLGRGKALLTVLTYLLIGLAGAPVFSGFKGGLSVLFGSTGGYLLSYLPMALIIGAVSDMNTKRPTVALMLASVSGLAVCYSLGSAYLAFVTGVDYAGALLVGAVPFVGFDIVKAVLATLAGVSLKRTLAKRSLI